MRLDTAAISEFKQLYFQEYGIQLSETEAADYGNRLVNMVKAVYGNQLPPVLFDKKGGKGIV